MSMNNATFFGFFHKKSYFIDFLYDLVYNYSYNEYFRRSKKMLETELKCIINKETFQKILLYYKWDKVVTQTNHYYRSYNDELKKHGITMRIREIDSKIKLQIKKHTNSDSPLQICEESEFEIPAILPYFTEEEVESYTGVKTEAFLIGSATTKRYSLMWDNTSEICLDHTIYLDTEDFEIEVEFVKECPKKLLDELKTLGVEFCKNSQGKYSRFIKRFIQLQKN